MLLIPARREDLLSCFPKMETALEIGVSKGDFSQSILERLNPTRLHLVDPWETPDYDPEKDSEINTIENQESRFQLVNQKFSSQIQSGQVKIHRGRSEDVKDQFPDSYFDWIYVDGIHTYEACLRDLRNYFPKLKETGFLMGDDYSNDIKFGVIQAVRDFCIESKCHMLAMNSLGMPNFVLVKRDDPALTQAFRNEVLLRFAAVVYLEGFPQYLEYKDFGVLNQHGVCINSFLTFKPTESLTNR